MFGAGCVDAGSGEDDNIGPDAGPTTATDVAERTTPYCEGEVDDYDEHWGESAYIVAMAWAYQGKTDAGQRAAADALVTGTRTLGEAGQLRSFNWQRRSAVATPYFLR